MSRFGKSTGSVVLMLTVAALFSGCVERRIIFRTPEGEPPCQVELDGVLIGTTPCEVKFHRYGSREWVARAEGRQPVGGVAELTAPWYEYPPIDLVVEGLLPYTIEETHQVVVSTRPIEARDWKAYYMQAALERDASEKKVAAAAEQERLEPKREGGMTGR